MKRHFHILFVISLLVFAFCAKTSLGVPFGVEKPVAVGLSADGGCILYEKKDVPDSQVFFDGNLANGQMLGQRTKRPNSSPNSRRIGGGAGVLSYQNHSNSNTCACGELTVSLPGVCRCLSVSYYVFALRHILC